MSKTEQQPKSIFADFEETNKLLTERIKELEGSLAEAEEDRHGFRAACDQAEGRVRCLREELEDAQRENLKLRGWQDCAREILGVTQRVTADRGLRVVVK